MPAPATQRPHDPIVRPLTAADRADLAAAFEQLSPESRYLRFATGKPSLSAAELRYLTEVDHRCHEALAVRSHDGRLIAVGRYVALDDDRDSAEVAVTVADDWRGRGIGPDLIERLAGRAHDEGFTRLVAVLLPHNHRAHAAARRAGFAGWRLVDGMAVLERRLDAASPSRDVIGGVARCAAAVDSRSSAGQSRH